MIRGIDMPLSYADLLVRGEPRSIRTDEDADAIQRQIDALLDKGELTDAEDAYLALLGDLMSSWEQDRYTLPETSPLERLCAMIADNEMSQADLVGPVFPTASIAHEVLSGKRSLTRDYAQRAARFFHVPAAVFLTGSEPVGDPPHAWRSPAGTDTK
jgi:HTH-type transcriptional regulator/antitoxin HigA